MKRIAFKISAVFLLIYFITIISVYGFFILNYGYKYPFSYVFVITAIFILVMGLGILMIYRSASYIRGGKKRITRHFHDSGSNIEDINLDEYDDISKDEIEKLKEENEN